jgi:hypothetical protein
LTGKIDDSEIDDLTGVYKEMNDNGKKKMVLVAGKLLTVQKILEVENPLKNKIEFNNERTD